MATLTKNRRSLLAPTGLPIFAQQTACSPTRSGTTATLTKTGITSTLSLAAGDWVFINGATHPAFNGLFQVVSTSTNSFTYAIAADPGVDGGSVATVDKVVVSSVWGDGSTANGLATVGALKTAFGGVLRARVANGASAPTSGPSVNVWYSGDCSAGSWRRHSGLPYSGYNATAGNDTPIAITLQPGAQYVLVGFWGVVGNAVTVQADGDEETATA